VSCFRQFGKRANTRRANTRRANTVRPYDVTKQFGAVLGAHCNKICTLPAVIVPLQPVTFSCWVFGGIYLGTFLSCLHVTVGRCQGSSSRYCELIFEFLFTTCCRSRGPKGLISPFLAMTAPKGPPQLFSTETPWPVDMLLRSTYRGS